MKNLVGQKGEDLAVEFLRKNGYLIKERNFKRKWGELDIIAFDKKTKEWVFVEVKAVSVKEKRQPFVFPEEKLTESKLKKLKKIILSYLSLKGIEESKWRFDLIAVEYKREGEEPEIRHYKGEFLEF